MTQRILIDARYVDGSPSGIGRYTQNVVERLADEPDLQITAVVRDLSHRDLLPASDWIEWDVEPNSPRTRYFFSRRIDWSRHDAFWSPFNILPEGVEVPAIFTLHDVMWLIDPSFCTQSRWRRLVTGSFYKMAIPRSVELADAIFTVSHTSRRDIEQLFPEARDRVHVTYNGVDPRFRPMTGDEGWDELARWMPRDTPFVLCVGQGSPYKNHGRALAAFWHAFASRPQMRFVMVRRFERGPDPILDEWLGRQEVARRVIRLNGISDSELRALLARAKLFAFPSLYEGFGLPALEAMASGTPVVTSDRGAMAEVSGGAGLEVDPLDIPAIADAMRRVVEDEESAADLRRRGVARARQFAWSQAADTVARVVRELI